MSSLIPPLIRELFDFWTMLAIIVAEFLVIFIIIVKAGPVGRFFLDLNLFPGSKNILIEQSHTNELKFRRVKSRGRNLKVKKDRYVFLCDLRRRGKDDPLTANENKFNEIVKNSAHIDGKPVYMGSVVASVGANPHLMETISLAQTGPKVVRDFFEGLKEMLGEKVSNIHILADFSIQDLAGLMNVVITEQRLESVFMEGELAGMNRYRQRDQVLMGVIIILVLGMCAMGWFLTRK